MIIKSSFDSFRKWQEHGNRSSGLETAGLAVSPPGAFLRLFDSQAPGRSIKRSVGSPPIQRYGLRGGWDGLHSRFLALQQILALFHPAHHKLHFERGNFFAFRVLVHKLS